MKKYKELKWLIIGALFLSVCGLIVAYISMSTALDIKEVNQFWKIEILNVKSEVKGKVTTSGVDVVSTSLNNFDINFDGQGTAIYKFELKNSGDVDVVLRNINYGNPKCTPYNNDIESCNNVSYKLTYSDGREVLTGDVINSGTHMDMQLVIEFGGSSNSGVKLNELDFILLYEQE